MIKKKIAISLAVILFYQTIHPLTMYALTSGPVQPEFSSFEPIGMTEMVDLFSGDFNYNIPLLNVPGEHGGYPINLFYKSPSSIEQEASMVGLGWNLGLGAITRQVNGIPDDFNGVPVSRKTTSKPEIDVSVGVGVGFEIFGKDTKKTTDAATDAIFSKSIDISAKALWNSYDGFGVSTGLMPGIKNDVVSASVGLNLNSFSGASYSASIGSKLENKHGKSSGSLSISGNNIDGLKSINVGDNQLLNYQFSDKPYFISYQDLEYKGFSFDLVTPLGPELSGAYPNAPISIGFSHNSLLYDDKVVSYPAYGNMFMHKGVTNSRGLLDFTRLKEKPIIENTSNLPFALVNEDIYTISGHGTGGSFCFSRSDNASLRDKNSSSDILGLSLHLEVGFGSLIEGGADITVPVNVTENAPYKVRKALSYGSLEEDDILEYGHFRKIGEMTGNVTESSNADHPFSENFDYLFRDLLVSPNLTAKTWGTRTRVATDLSFYPEKFNPVSGLPGYKSQQVRRARRNSITGITRKDLMETSLSLNYLQKNVFQGTNFNTYDHPELPLTDDEINTFIETKENGDKYVYAVPVYNKTKVEVVASYGGEVEGVDEVIVPLDVIQDENDEDILNPETGISGSKNLVDEKTMPQYAQSYLLSYVLGDNYIDMNKSDGEPNDLDRGHWVKFEYNKMDDYQWRFPFYGGQFNPGSHSLNDDNTISFSYGVREQYYTKSIETNSHIAYFEYDDRTDGFGVHEKFQTKDSPMGSGQQKLLSIELFAKAPNNEETLIKRVEFDYYDDGLGSGFPNAEEGKLALKNVFVTNYESDRGMSNPYHFKYFDTSDFTYSTNQSDRWGCYQRIRDEDGEPADKNYFSPYTVQNNDYAKDNIEAFHLSSIQLPSGAKISIDLERDDYAYVQNHVATEMIKIAGIGAAGENFVDFEDTVEPFEIFFEVGNDFDASELKNYVEDLYEDDQGKQILFKLYSHVFNNENGVEDKKEFITVAAYLDDSSLVNPVVENGIASIKILPLNGLEDIKVQNDFNGHPFAVAAWQHLKINLRKLLTPGGQLDEVGQGFGAVQNGSSNVLEFVNVAKNAAKNILNQANLFRGFYRTCFANEHGSLIDLDKSFMRLNSPTKKKLGGNARVSKITMGEIWDKENTPTYGNEYIYTVPHTQANGETVEISSGVAQNEPFIGKEENAIYYIKSFVEDLRWTTDNLHFELHPFNDGDLPGPQVGYSKVTVRSLASQDLMDNNSSKFSSSGEAVHEFFTAKDFPFVLENTIVDQALAKPKWVLLPFIGSVKNQFYSGVQGYMAETNDMHGKPKRVSYYAQDNAGIIVPMAVSSVEYFYKSKSEPYQRGKKQMTRQRLVNDEIPLLVDLETNMVLDGEIGVDRKLNLDSRYVSSEAHGPGLQANLNTIYSLIPLPIPTIFPKYNLTSSKTETGVMSKSIKRKGVLDSIVAYDGQSKVVTENLIFDPLTGSAVQTAVTNEFNERIFSTQIPAYHVYDRMGPAYQNEGFQFSLLHDDFPIDRVFQSDLCSGLRGFQYEGELPLIPGDQLRFIQKVNNTETLISGVFYSKQEATVLTNGVESTVELYLMDFMEQLVDLAGSDYEVKIIQSGNNNRLGDIAQSVSTLTEPEFIVAADNANPIVNFEEVLQAGATTYNDFWHFNDEQDFLPDNAKNKEQKSNSLILNHSDFNNGGMNIFRTENSFQYQEGMRLNIDNNKKGVFSHPVGLFNWRNVKNNPAWLSGTKITKYSKSGQVSETKNSLGIYSARLFTILPSTRVSEDKPMALNSPSAVLATMSNSRYYESAFSSFETYEYPSNHPSGDIGDAGQEIYNHFDMSRQTTEASIEELYTNVCFPQAALKSAGAIFSFTIDKPYNAFKRFVGGRADMYFPYEFGNEFESFTMEIVDEKPVNGNPALTIINVMVTGDCDQYISSSENAHVIISNKGDICGIEFLICNRETIRFSDDFAHTGSQSLEIINSSVSVDLDNFSLDIYPDKKYFASCWVYVDDPSLNDYTEIGLEMEIEGAEFIPIRKTINGWQQFRAEFTKEVIVGGSDQILNKKTHLEINTDTEYSSVYIDDIRILPFEAQMEAYVYDPVTHQLKYVLDDNNYYSKYVYDGDGNLISIQKETERGVKSLQENRTYLAASEYVDDITKCKDELCNLSYDITTNSDNICEGENVNLSVTGAGAQQGVDYLWSTGSQASSISVTAEVQNGVGANSYEVTITDGLNCEAVEHITFDVIEGPNIYSIEASVNECGQGILEIYYESIDGSDQIIISANGEEYFLPTDENYYEIILEADGYEVIAHWEDNDCMFFVGDIEVEGDGGISVEISGEDYCLGESSILSATVLNPNGDVTYQWSTGDHSVETVVGESMVGSYIYHVTVSDENGCVAFAEQVINVDYPPNASVSSVNAVCETDMGIIFVEFEAGLSGQVEFSFDGGQTYGPQAYNIGDGLIEISMPAGEYNLWVQWDKMNPCPVSLDQCIVIFDAPCCYDLVCSETSTPELCGNDGTASIEVSGGIAPYTYQWSNGQFTNMVSDLSAGIYQITVTDAANCSSVCEVTILDEIDTVSIDVEDQIICLGSLATLEVIPIVSGDSYVWSNGATTQSIEVGEGTYTVVVTNASGCTGATSAVVTSDSNFVITCDGEDDLCGTGDGSAIVYLPITCSGGCSVLWSTGATTNQIEDLSAGTYVVTVTSPAGCEAACSVEIEEPDQIAFNCRWRQREFICPEDGNWGTMEPTWTPGCDIEVMNSGNGNTVQIDVLPNVGTCSAEGPNGVTLPINANGVATIAGANLMTGEYLITCDDSGCIVETVFNITVTACCEMTCSVSGEVNNVCGSDDQGGFTITVEDGEAPYEFSGGVLGITTTSNPSNSWSGLPDGNYCVTITDSNECTTECCYEVIDEGEDLDIEIIGETGICIGGTTMLEANSNGLSPITYEWSTGEMDSEIETDVIGNISVTVTDANGCSGTDLVMTTNLTNPGISCTSTIGTCSDPATATVTVGYNPAFDYAWSNGGSGQMISGMPAGDYTVTVTDLNGCTNTCVVTVEVNDDAPVCSLESEIADCEISIDATVTGGSSTYGYAWSNGATTQNISGLTTGGTYTLTVTDSNGCTNSCSTTINTLLEPISVSFSSNGGPQYCEGSSVSVNAVANNGQGPYSYLWTSNSMQMIDNPNTAMQNFNGQAAGNYSYTVEITDANGCVGEGTITVIVHENPSCSTTVVHTSCGFTNGSVTANPSGGSGSYTYAWSTGASTSSISNLGSGTYSVTITDSNGCETTCSRTVNSSTNVVCTISSTDENCPGDANGSATVVATGGVSPYSYQWSNGNVTSSTINGLTPGTYTVTVSDNEDCTTTCSVYVGGFVCEITSNSYDPITCMYTIEYSGVDCGSALLDVYSPSGDFDDVEASLNDYDDFNSGEAMIDLSAEDDEWHIFLQTPDYNCILLEDFPYSECGCDCELNVEYDNEACTVSAITNNCDGSIDYIWSTGETTDAIDVDELGEYSLTISVDGCDDIFSNIIVEEALQIVEVDLGDYINSSNYFYELSHIRIDENCVFYAAGTGLGSNNPKFNLNDNFGCEPSQDDFQDEGVIFYNDLFSSHCSSNSYFELDGDILKLYSDVDCDYKSFRVHITEKDSNCNYLDGIQLVSETTTCCYD